MTWLQWVVAILAVWFAAAIATIAAYNAVKSAVLRRRSRLSLAALYAEAGTACGDCRGSGRLITSGWDDEGFACPPCSGTGIMP